MPAVVEDQSLLDGDARRDQWDAAIHDYLLAHGDVVLQSLQDHQKHQQAVRMDALRPALLADPTDPVADAPGATVTVVEFFDNECPFCKKIAPDLARLMAENRDVRIVYKEYPILGPGSQIAARAAMASMKQGKYDPFHAALMADATPEHQLAEPRVMEIAKGVGLDVTRLKADMAAPEIAAKIAGNGGLARQLGITGTPGLIIGDKVMSGAVPYQVMAEAVANARVGRQRD
ncbi:MAG TPA: DsbA family protein [Rhodospirillaceae bacterium]|nr:DsbA family protein [Rhodospirillaceae bacterium]